MEKTVAAYDLHNHSCWSYDARNLPEFYFKKAKELGMKAFAVTDHHNFDVIPSMFELAKQYPGVPFFTGAEFSASTPFGDMDFVCLGLPKEPTPMPFWQRFWRRSKRNTIPRSFLPSMIGSRCSCRPRQWSTRALLPRILPTC